MRRYAGDAVLVLVMAGLLWAGPKGPLTTTLLAGIPIVLIWGILTLHFPARVEMDGEHIAFFGYGRVHRFAWSAIDRIRVRRFLVQDRVLVRITPASAFRGRYWLLNSIDGYESVVRALEERARTRS
ncbi:MAG TPA: hypothetical protein VGL13_06375 [Polyangiaceae bacterium]